MANKIALVTGGSRGLGRDMVLNLAQQGIDVVFTYHKNREKAQEVLEEVKSMGQKALMAQLDTRNVESFDAFYSNLHAQLRKEMGTGRFDFLINNAGTGIHATFDQTTEEQFDELMNIHFKGVFFFTQKALRYLNDGGRIINISSGLARFSLPGFSAYGAMKGAVEVFTRYLARELGSRGIVANVLAPGAIATDFGGGVNRDNEGKRKLISSITALGRVGEPEDIGGLVGLLCSDKSGWINGQRIEASGGMLV